ncbi:MAG: hypothetical protein H0T80_11735 [Betaproteobacteria bacterium]|nr:hypothetical protein [Betaproteobacteria bacterium]MBA3775539.1 hypothetical protein [Betaproteobacteria bacterium]
MREVVIAGIGSTFFGRHAGVPIEALAVRAAAAALVDAGVDRERIGALYLGDSIKLLLALALSRSTSPDLLPCSNWLKPKAASCRV